MAVFDPDAQKVVVRVVYDGPGVAGKTTNLQQLCKVFTTFRRSELYSPDAIGGRTTYLDWLQVDSGLVAGRALRSHFLTVPGQSVLARRRFQLVALADVVVFVVEATPLGVKEGATHLGILKMYLEARRMDVPIVVQANKQDISGTLDATQVAAQLGLDAGTPVVAAQACAGIGVRETAVLAIRAAADRVQTEMRERGIEALYGRAETGEQLRSRIQSEEQDDPMTPVALVLEHRDLARRVESEALQADRVPDSRDWNEARAAVDGAPVREEPSRSVVGDSAPPTEQSPTADWRARVPPPSTAPEIHEAASGSLEVPRATPNSDTTPADFVRPPFPGPDVPSGLVWPATTGRDVLRRVPLDEARFRADLRGSFGVAEGSGRTDTFVYEAGIWCLKTSPRRRYSDTDDAKGALLQLVRRKIQLTELLVRDTVVSLARDADGQLWLWTVTPWLTTLRGLMTSATDHGDQEALGSALATYANTAVDCAALTVRQGLVLDIHPSNFAFLDERAFYLDDDIWSGTSAPSLGYALLNRMDEYAAYPQAISRYLDALCSAIRCRLSQEECAALELGRSIEGTLVRSSVALDAKHVLLENLSTTLRSTG